MISRIQHRHLLALPFVLIGLLTLVGGLANSMDARGRVIDEVTRLPVANTTIAHGERAVLSDAAGEFVLPNVPRTSKLSVRPPSGYQLMTVFTSNAGEIALNPLALTIYAFDEAKDRETGPVPNPQARDVENTKILANGNASGQIVVAPHPATDEGENRQRIVVCGEGFEPKEIAAEGVLIEVGLKAGGTGCPPLPTPTPDPNATPTPAPTASPATDPNASPSPSPAPTPTPSPTGTP